MGRDGGKVEEGGRRTFVQHVGHGDTGDRNSMALGDFVEGDGDGRLFARVDVERTAAVFGGGVRDLK